MAKNIKFILEIEKKKNNEFCNFINSQTFMLLLCTLAVVTGLNQIKRQRRAPNVQAYGLPKRLLITTNYGAIEKIHLGARLSVTTEEFNKSNNTTDVNPSLPSGHANPLNVRVHPHPKDFSDVEGHLERISLDSDDLKRSRRSVDNNAQLDDLEAAESKVFRPLFVYRQQVAERHRANRSKNPIYGAYQYGPIKKPSHHVQKVDCNSNKRRTNSAYRYANSLV